MCRLSEKAETYKGLKKGELFLIGVLEAFLVFALIVALSVAVSVRFQLASGAAPLAVLCGSVLWYTLAACAGLLFPAAVVWIAAAAAAGGWAFWRRDQVKKAQLFSPSFVFFLLAGAAIILLLGIRQPLFMEWDEFSFWGIAPKVVKETNMLYVEADTEMRVITYAPGLVLLSHLFEFVGAGFAPWKVYAAYDILMFAIFAAALSSCEKKHWHIAVMGGTIMVLLPYLMTVYIRNVYVETVYISSYADIPMGLLFGVPLALYFTQREKGAPVLLTACSAIAMTCLSKEMGLALALIAAAIIAFDVLFVNRSEIRIGKLPALPSRLIWCAALGASAVVPYTGWAQYRSSVTGASVTELGGSQNMQMFEMLFTGIKELLGIGRTERFSRVMSQMWQAFYSTSLSEFSVGNPSGGIGKYFNGSGLIIVLVILAVLALAFWYADKAYRPAVAWFTLWSSLGFAAFYIFTGFTYIYIFHEWQEMTDYNRYIYPYYLGWMLAAVAVLCFVLRGARGKVVASGGLAVLMLFCVWRTSALVPANLSVVDYPESYFAGRREKIKEIEEVKALLTPEDKVFYVAMGDDGKGWFTTYYEAYPDLILDYSFGGGTLTAAVEESLFVDENDLGIEKYYAAQNLAWDEKTQMGFAVPGILAMPDDFTEEQKEYYTTHGLTPDVLCEYLRDTQCTALYLDTIDPAFEAAYGSLFIDGLKSGAMVYRIEDNGKEMRFVPVEKGEKSA